MGEVNEVTITDSTFNKEVLEAGLPVLVDFWAEWCGPCRMIAPVVGEIAAEYKGRVKVCKLNVDSGPQTASQYGIMNIPTLMIFKSGKAVDKIVGAVSKGVIIAKIDPHLS